MICYRCDVQESSQKKEGITGSMKQENKKENDKSLKMTQQNESAMSKMLANQKTWLIELCPQGNF